jgi:hypothetical protein
MPGPKIANEDERGARKTYRDNAIPTMPWPSERPAKKKRFLGITLDYGTIGRLSLAYCGNVSLNADM